ncbi:MAG TPA: hypothetical protein VEA63_10565, partial [Opitutus sp.]|nr:hypothetical protein [Opitutus sp.]
MPTVFLHPLQRLDKRPTDMRLIDDQEAVVRDESRVDRASLRTHAISAEKQTRTGLIHGAA